MDGNTVLNKQAFLPLPIEAWESCLRLVEREKKYVVALQKWEYGDY